MCKSTKIKCPRCGGSGETEFTHVVHGVCFMCKGEGLVYPKRVVELAKKDEVRKANKEAKYQQELKESKKRDDNYWESVYSEITRRNKIYFENYKCATHKNAMNFYEKIQWLAEYKGFDSNTTESEVRKMFKRFLKEESWAYRLEISKYTLKYHNFCFIDLDGKENDFTDCMHEVQNLIKR